MLDSNGIFRKLIGEDLYSNTISCVRADGLVLEVIILTLEIMHEESSHMRLKINWNKTKIQALNHFRVPVNGPSPWSSSGGGRLVYIYGSMCRFR